MSLISITSATIFAAQTIDLVYTAPVTAGDFDETAFTSNPSTEQPLTIAQNGANGLRLSMSADITDDDSITYNGATIGVLTPQTVLYT